MRRLALAGSLAACTALALSAGAQVADAAATPTAYTGEAAQLTSSSATLNGSVYPSNQQTSYYFQYGQTGTYGAQTPLTLAGGGTQSIHVTVPIAGLSPAAVYHYRLVAVNPSGTVNGQDRTFTTKAIPLTFNIPVMRGRVLFDSPFSVGGTVSGTRSALSGIDGERLTGLALAALHELKADELLVDLWRGQRECPWGAAHGEQGVQAKAPEEPAVAGAVAVVASVRERITEAALPAALDRLA